MSEDVVMRHDPMARQSRSEPPSLFDLPAQAAPTGGLVYGGEVPSRPVATSRAAAKKVQGAAPTIRMSVLAWVRASGASGLTGEEAGDKLAQVRGLPKGNTASRLSAGARITELRLVSRAMVPCVGGATARPR